MSFIEINLDDVHEPKAAAAGWYPLQITGCEVAKSGPNSKNPGSPQFKVTIGFIDEPDAMNITHYVSLPTGDTSEEGQKSDKFKAILLKRFLYTFNVPYDSRGIDVEALAMQMVGAQAQRAEVSLGEPDPNTGNVYNRLQLRPIPNEGGR